MLGHLLESKLQYYVPERFWQVFHLWGNTPVNIREQQDALDFFQAFIDQVDEQIKVDVCMCPFLARPVFSLAQPCPLPFQNKYLSYGRETVRVWHAVATFEKFTVQLSAVVIHRLALHRTCLCRESAFFEGMGHFLQIFHRGGGVTVQPLLVSEN